MLGNDLIQSILCTFRLSKACRGGIARLGCWALVNIEGQMRVECYITGTYKLLAKAKPRPVDKFKRVDSTSEIMKLY